MKKFLLFAAFAVALFASCEEENLVDANNKEVSGYVDLKLPSGTLWATCNVGATSPGEHGVYFAWGETTSQPSNHFDWDSYKLCDRTYNTLTKYFFKTSEGIGTPDNQKVLSSDDDAATANWGSSWKMPTMEQFEELSNPKYCKWTWSHKGSAAGYMIVAADPAVSSDTLFLPASGYGYLGGRTEGNSTGHYWTSQVNTADAHLARSISFNSKMILTENVFSENMHQSFRCYGLTVRPVRK